MKPTENTIREIILSNEFSNHYDGLNERTREKYAYAMQIIMTMKVVSGKFVKKIINTEFYEVRISVGTNEYRTILIATDNPNFIESTRVIFLNSFPKKATINIKEKRKKQETL